MPIRGSLGLLFLPLGGQRDRATDGTVLSENVSINIVVEDDFSMETQKFVRMT